MLDQGHEQGGGENVLMLVCRSLSPLSPQLPCPVFVLQISDLLRFQEVSFACG